MPWLRSKFFKRLRNRALIGLTRWGVRLLYLTVRFRSEGWNEVRDEVARDGVIYVIWHNVLMLPLGHPCRHGVRAFVSVGKDGEFAARVVAGFGIGAVRGSTSRAGARALKEAIAAANGGPCNRFALTPDGPRGPRYRFQDGATWLASQTGLPVVPIGVAVSRAWHLNSWDRHRIPKPFSRACFVFGSRIDVPRDLGRGELEAHTAQLERSLREASSRAAENAGVSWPDPATS